MMKHCLPDAMCLNIVYDLEASVIVYDLGATVIVYDATVFQLVRCSHCRNRAGKILHVSCIAA